MDGASVHETFHLAAVFHAGLRGSLLLIQCPNYRSGLTKLPEISSCSRLINAFMKSV